MGIELRPLRRVFDAHQGHQLYDPFLHLTLAQPLLMDGHRLGDLPADGDGGVQSGQRVLEYHGKELSAQFPHLPFGAAGDVPSVRSDGAGDDGGTLGEQSHDALAQNALAAARLPHQRQHFPRRHGKGHVPHRLDDPGGGGDVDGEVFHFQQIVSFHSVPPLTENQVDAGAPTRL